MLVVPTDSPEETLAVLEALLGPLPQAELAGDVEIWVELPGLAGADWLAVREALPQGAELVPGEPGGRRAARDLGLVAEEVVELEGLVLVHRVDTEPGLSIWPQLLPGLPDPAVMTLETELVEALGKNFRSDRGAGTTQPVLCPQTGRFGVVLAFDETASLTALAEQLLPLIHARASHAELRLAPTLEVDRRVGLSLLLWFVAPHRPVLPSDLAFAAGQSPTELDGLVEQLGGAVRSVEIQVLPREDHHAAALAAAAHFEELPFHASPWVPRWSIDGRLLATWTVECSGLDSLAGLRVLLDEPSIEAVRVMPGEPAGIDLPYEVFDLGGTASDQGWAIRLRHGVSGRDLLPAAHSRDSDPAHEQDEQHLYAVLAEAPGASFIAEPRLARPVADGAGEPGIELRLDPREACDPELLRQSLIAVLAVDLPRRSPVVFWGRRAGDVVVQVWRQRPPSAEPAGEGISL